MALAAGLLGGAGHCVGMCGPIAASWSLRDRGHNKVAWSAASENILYNLGRITTYAFIGGLMGAGGSFVGTAGTLVHAQRVVVIVAGAMMILLGLDVAGALGFAKKIEKPDAFIKAARFVMEGESPSRFYPLGLVLGLMPCGLSYTIFISAAASGDFFRGMAIALAFGLGTVPALFLFGTLVGATGAKLRGALYRVSGVVIALMGALYLYRGIAAYAHL